MSKLATLPVIAPLIALLRSRKFLALVSALIVNVVIAKIPELASARDLLIGTVTFGTLVLIGGIAYEDSAQAGRDAANAPVVPSEDIIRNIVTEIMNGLLASTPPVPSNTTVNVVTPPQSTVSAPQ